jgi:hypothetical protein
MMTFAAGSKEMQGAGKRLTEQANKSGLFANSLLITEDNLFDLDADGSKLKYFVSRHQKGYGLFAWKSYIINLAMQGYFGEYEGVFYADAGCELLWNKKSLKYFEDLMRQTKEFGIVAFRTPLPEFFYTKKDVLALLNNPEHIYTPQIEATVIFADPCSHSAVKLVKDWWELSAVDDFKYLVDPDRDSEMVEFVEHRWDQSILSVLLKNSGYRTLADSTPRYTGSLKHISYLHYLVFTPWPIWAIRNRSAVTRLGSWQNLAWLSLILDPLYQKRLNLFKVHKYLIHVMFALRHRIQIVLDIVFFWPKLFRKNKYVNEPEQSNQ